MKKISVVSTIIALSLMAGSAAYSQPLALSKTRDNTPVAENGLKEPVAVSPVEKEKAVSPKSLASFQQIFGDMPGVKWSKINRDHDRAYFVNDGITVRAGFNRKGELMYTIRWYTEEQLAGDILKRIKETYFGKSIFGVIEVSVDDQKVYLVDLEDKTSWLRIKINDEEMNEEYILMKR